MFFANINFNKAKEIYHQTMPYDLS